MAEIESIPIDRYVCDSCNDPLTTDDGVYIVTESYAVRYEHGLYCPHCAAKFVGYRKKAHEKPDAPLRVYILGDVIDDLSREMCISSLKEFDPEEHR